MAEAGLIGDQLIGRDNELGQLRAVLTAAQHGRRSLVVVTGDAGIGKTRLCEELAARARAGGFRSAFGACWPDGGAPALWPWHDVLADLCGRDVAELLHGDRGVSGVDSDRFSRFAAVAEQLVALSQAAPTLVVIDDAHVADAGALLLARFLVQRLRDSPFVLVLTRRPTVPDDATVASLLDGLSADGLVLPLGGLDLSETEAFLHAYGEDADPELLAAVHRVTAGNPLFVRQLVAFAPSQHGRRRLPDGVRDLVDRVMSGLDAEVRAILRFAAVLGRTGTIVDLGAVSREPLAGVFAAVDEGRRVGFVTPGALDEYSFSHELIREAMEASLAPADRLDAHARAARAVEGTGAGDEPARLVRRAGHAIAAAPRSAEDARRAVDVCRAAAAELVRGFAYEQAAAALADAARAHERSGLGRPPAALLVDWANVVLLYGNLGEARVRFDRAASAAADEGDAVLLAKAALGLGGVWVNEHRTPAEQQRVRGLQLKALAGLPARERVLAARLRMRIAAEDSYPDGAIEEAVSILEEIREIGDGRALAEALSMVHHVLLPPRHLTRRLALADELIGVAAAAGDAVLILMGLCWRAVDLFQMGYPSARRALAELRQRADALNCRSILYIAETMDVMLLIRDGALEEAEARATSCYELGVEVGDADSLGYFGGHLVTIRYVQGREDEIVDAVAEMGDAPTIAQDDFAVAAAAAAMAARAGQLSRARALFDRLTAPGIENLVQSSTWLAGMFGIAETAAILEDAAVARRAYALLRPFAAQPIMPSLAVTCFGSTERPLGLAALAFGDINAAIDHLERAAAANEALGHRPLIAITQADLAGALGQRAHAGDRERAVALLEQALADADAMRLTGRAEVWRGQLAALRSRSEEAALCVRRDGSGWVVAMGERRAVVSDLIGMTYLAGLVARPGVEISALELAGGSDALHSRQQPLLDHTARAAYEQRARDIAADLAEAEDHADLGRVEKLRDELDAIAEELGRATGIHGRDRGFSGPGERARTAVRKAIKRSIDEIERVDADLGAFLRRSVTTGTTCAYLRQ